MKWNRPITLPDPFKIYEKSEIKRKECDKILFYRLKRKINSKASWFKQILKQSG